MDALAAQLRETLLINHRVNLLLLDELTDESLAHTLAKRGGTVGHQLAHLYNVRFWKLERLDKRLVQDLVTIKAEEVKTVGLLRNCHVDSAANNSTHRCKSVARGSSERLQTGINTTHWLFPADAQT